MCVDASVAEASAATGLTERPSCVRVGRGKATTTRVLAPFRLASRLRAHSGDKAQATRLHHCLHSARGPLCELRCWPPELVLPLALLSCGADGIEWNRIFLARLFYLLWAQPRTVRASAQASAIGACVRPAAADFLAHTQTFTVLSGV